MVHTAPYVIYALDLEGRFIELNRASGPILGRDPAELIGRPITDIVAADHEFTGSLLTLLSPFGLRGGLTTLTCSTPASSWPLSLRIVPATSCTGLLICPPITFSR